MGLLHRSLHVVMETETTTAFEKASMFQLALTGMFFGLLHVLTGPDHLSALATLAAGTSWRSFALGIRWGCGHSIGLILMAIIFILLDGELDFTLLNVITDVLVGVFMIALGLYGIQEGVKKKSRERKLRWRERKNDGQIQHTDEKTGVGIETETETESESLESPSQTLLQDKKRSESNEDMAVTCSDDDDDDDDVSPAARKAEANWKKAEDSKDDVVLVDVDLSARRTDATMVDETSPRDSVVALEELLSDCSEESSDTKLESEARGLKCCGLKLPSVDFQNPRTQKCTALVVGIVHGIAGPGGILGVLPAVGLHNTAKSVTYLGSFCFMSILTMGLFAAGYGEASGRLGDRSDVVAFRISIFSSMLSVIVGILWLVLVAIGKLQDVIG